MKKIVMTMLFALSAFALMSGCSSDSTPASTTLSGTAATGAPIDGTVTVKDAKGAEVDITTGTNGSFSLNVAGMTAPFLLKIMPSDGTATLYSYATEIGQTVNLTPTTNLAMFIASGNVDLDAMYAAWDGTAVTAAQVATAEGTVRANLITQMEAAGLDVASYDLFTTAFTADGTGIDGVLDDLSIVVDAGTGSFTFTDAAGTDLVFDPNATPPAPPAPDGAIAIATVTGKTHVLNGAYSTGCYTIDGGAASAKEDLDISGSIWSYTNTEYTSADCTTGATVGTATGTLVAGTDSAIIGWYDGSGSPAAVPAATDGVTVISGTEAFTPLTLTFTAVTGSFVGQIPVGETFPLFYVVDDTAAKAVLYRDNSYDTGDLNAGIYDPYTQQ